MSSPDTAATRTQNRALLASVNDATADILAMFARAIADGQRYCLFIAHERRSSVQVTNIDDPLTLARFLERFARQARKDAEI